MPATSVQTADPIALPHQLKVELRLLMTKILVAHYLSDTTRVIEAGSKPRRVSTLADPAPDRRACNSSRRRGRQSVRRNGRRNLTETLEKQETATAKAKVPTVR